MNFGLGKMRPMGHDHVYKYAHCKTAADMQAASNRNYLKDKDAHGRFLFPLLQMKSITNLFNDTVAEYIDIECPEATEAVSVISFRENKTLKYFKGNLPKCTGAHAFAFQCYGSIPRREITLIMPVATDITSMFGDCKLGDGCLKIYAPNAINSSGLDTWTSTSNVREFENNSDFYFPNVENAKDMFATINYNEVYYWLNENGESVVGHGGTPTEKKYVVFPKLKNGSGLFYRSTITADYATAICQSLPDWSGDTSNHPLSLGIHVDDKYNPDLQMELLKVGNNYTPTINVSGGPTTNKNWELTLKWNGTSSGHAYRPPMGEVEFSSNEIPENYTRCDYLESNGSQYIKTGYIPNDASGVFIDAYMNKNGFVLGSNNHGANWTGTNNFNIQIGTTPSAPHAGWPVGGGYFPNPDVIQVINTRFKCRMNYKNDRYLYYDFGENKWYKEDLSTFVKDNELYDIYLFAINSAGNITKSSGRIYRAQITENDLLIKDYVPCLDNEGVPCFYELINGETLYNSGSGQFTYEVITN